MNHMFLMKCTILSLTTFFLSACVTAPQANPSPPPSSQSITTLAQIAYGTSFGFCRGRCDHRLVITAERMHLVHQSLQDPEKYPEQVIEQPTPVETWKTLNRLASFKTLQDLPERIGCPDCADGGAEWIELQQDNVNKRVTFEPQVGLAQQAELLAELRKLYQELTADESAT